MPPLHIEWNPHRLALQWQSSGALHLICASSLRRHCRCAHCRVHAPAAAELNIVGLELIGHYGLRLFFSDGHDRGIYPWPLLASLSQSLPDPAYSVSASCARRLNPGLRSQP